MKQMILYVMLMGITVGMKFSLQIQGVDKQCFFEVLDAGQKYSVQAIPKTQSKYELEIANGDGGKWNSVYYKATSMSYEKIQVHKLTNISSTYSFCFKNLNREVLQLTVSIESGLQLMDFELLPDEADAENLNREIEWLEGQKKKLFNSVAKMESMRSVTRGVTNIMSTKMIAFAILGLFVVLAVNFLFYRETKRLFKDRKII